MLPSEMFYLSVEFRKQYPDQASDLGQANRELSDLSRASPTDISPQRLSADFGVPHSVLLLSNSRMLLNMKPPPAFGGYANRLLAQSWESNNLYWARLADEMGYSPVMLNVLVPALTRRMVVNIFASTYRRLAGLVPGHAGNRGRVSEGQDHGRWRKYGCSQVVLKKLHTGFVMTKKSFAVFGSLSCLIYMGVGSTQLAPQDDPMRLRMNVVLVQLNVAVTDSHGNYVTGLRPQDFSVS